MPYRNFVSHFNISLLMVHRYGPCHKINLEFIVVYVFNYYNIMCQKNIFIFQFCCVILLSNVIIYISIYISLIIIVKLVHINALFFLGIQCPFSLIFFQTLENLTRIGLIMLKLWLFDYNTSFCVNTPFDFSIQGVA